MTGSGMDRWTHPAVILVATDLDDLGRLMPFALREASETGGRLILLHVLPIGIGMAVDPTAMPYYDPAGALEFAARTLHPWCAAAREKDIACDALVREGNPAQQIAAAVRQFQVDRILLGTRSRGKATKLLLGSVAEQVLRSVNLPVITVGPEAHLPVGSIGHEKVVLHATKLRETSRPSAALACQLAAQLNAELVLLHVLPPADEMAHEGALSDFDAAAARELQALAAETAASGSPQIETIVLHGNPFIEILAEAATRKANLIVLGATHHTVFDNLTRDRTVYRVIAHARCPVLTLREAEASQVDPQPEQTSVSHA
ncbi:MAG: universal stress protein [Terriglobia bacterium]|nr:universal stress protein [Terriglobia bacterium]